MPNQTVNINIRANGAKTVRREMSGLQKSIQRIGSTISKSSVALAGLGAAAAASAVGLVSASDAVLNLQNQTRVFSTSQEQATFKMQDTIQIARDLNATLNEVGQVYQRLSLVQDGIGLDDETTSQIVRNLVTAVKLSGATAQEAEGALRQFSQGLAANRLSGQELNSVLEQTPLVAKILADSLEVATGDLRALGEAGELTTDVLVNAFGREITTLDAQLKNFTFTLSSELQQLRQEVTLFFGSLLNQSGVAKSFGSIVKENLTRPLSELTDTIRRGGPEATRLLDKLSIALGALAGAGVAAALAGIVGSLLLIGGPVAVGVAAATLAVGGLTGGLLAAGIAAEKNLTSTERLTKLSNELSKANARVAITERELTLISNQSQRDRFVDKLKNQRNEVLLLELAIGDLRKARQDQLAQEIRDAKLIGDTSINANTAFAKLAGINGLGGPSNQEPSVQKDFKEEIADLVKAYDPLTAATEKQESALKALNEVRGQLSASQFNTIERNINKEFQRSLDLINEVTDAKKEQKTFDLEAQQLREDLLDLQQRNNAVLGVEAQAREDIAVLEAAVKAKLITDLNEILRLEQAIKAEREFQLEVAQRQQAQRDLQIAGADGTLTPEEQLKSLQLGAENAFATIAAQITDLSGIVESGLVGAFNLVNQSITNLATTGEANWKAFGRSILQVIQQIIVQLLVAVSLQKALQAFGNFGSSGGESIAANTQGLGGALGGFNPSVQLAASGGPVSPRRPVLVGERGPELFVPPRSGSIKNATTTASLTSQSAQPITIVNVTSMDAVLDALGSEEAEGVILNVMQTNSDLISRNSS